MLFPLLGICSPNLYKPKPGPYIFYLPVQLFPLFTCPLCREADLYGIYKWAVLLSSFPLALVNWRAEESGYFLYPALSLLWPPPVGALSQSYSSMDSSKFPSPCSLGPEGNRNFLPWLVFGYYSILLLAFLNTVYTFVISPFIKRSLIIQFEYICFLL